MKVRLKYLRLMRGLSVKQLSDASGVSIPTILRIEKGNFPLTETLVKLATALDVKMEELVLETDEDKVLQKAS